MTLLDVSLDQLVDVVRGVSFPTAAKQKSHAPGLVACLRTTNVQDRVEWDDLLYVDEAYIRSEDQLIRVGDILISMSNSLDLVGKCALVTQVPRRATFGTFIAVVRPKPGVNPRYVFHAMRAPAFKAYIRDAASTTTNISNINASKLVAAPLPLSGAAACDAIASRIEELFSEIDEGERALERVGQLVERYRQSVLKAAVTGELTREWRHQRQVNARPGVLGQFEAARSRAGNRDAPVAMADVEGLPDLPESWSWASLATVAEVAGGITVDKKRSPDGCDEVPYLRVANVQRGYLDLAEVKTIVAPRDRIHALRLAPGDILFNEGGDIDKLGRGWLWQGELPLCIHQNHVFRARLFVPGPWNKLISWFCNVLGRRLFMDMGKQTTNLASLSLSRLKSVPVPLMPHEEAGEIVSRVEDALSLIDKCLAEVVRQRAESSALRQSILKAAFSGQLVPQDPADEPASALLDRLRVQATEPATPKRRGRKGAA